MSAQCRLGTLVVFLEYSCSYRYRYAYESASLHTMADDTEYAPICKCQCHMVPVSVLYESFATWTGDLLNFTLPLCRRD